MMLWTWQGFGFDPPFDPVDRSKSNFLNPPACPDIDRAYRELDELLTLPTDRKGQFLWCSTVSLDNDPWYKRCLWPIDAPQESILTLVSSPIWEHLIDSKSIPLRCREKWKLDLYSRQVVGDRSNQEMGRRECEYHKSFPSRTACLAELRSPTKPGEDVLALLRVPIDSSWICPCDLEGRRRRKRG